MEDIELSLLSIQLSRLSVLLSYLSDVFWYEPKSSWFVFEQLCILSNDIQVRTSFHYLKKGRELSVVLKGETLVARSPELK